VSQYRPAVVEERSGDRAPDTLAGACDDCGSLGRHGRVSVIASAAKQSSRAYWIASSLRSSQ